MGQSTCPNCGMQQTEWLGSDRHGYRAEDRLFCCQGCATGGAGACTCRVANPGIELTGAGHEGAETLLTPRDRNGRPLTPDEAEELAAEGLPVQLPDTVTERPAPVSQNPRAASTN